MEGHFQEPNARGEESNLKPLLDKEAQITLSALSEASYNGSMSSFKNSSKVGIHLESRHKRLSDFAGWIEVKKQCRIAAPMIYVNLLQFSLQIISVMFVGHLGELALSSASIATSFAGVTGNSILLGMGSALETLCGQAYGAGQYHLLGLFLQRAVLVLNVTCIPLAFLWANMGNILHTLGQDPEISEKAGEYAFWLMPTLFAYGSLQPLVKFLQAQSIVIPMVVSSSITLCFHIPFCWAMVYKSGLGNRGAALATSISNWINVLLLLVYVRYSDSCKKTRAPMSWEALHDLKGFIKLAIPSTLMICLEYWSFEMLVLFSGLLPNPQLETSTLSICLSTAALAYMIPFGLSAAASTRVSNELGSGSPEAARGAVYVAVCLAAVETSVVSITLFLSRNVLGRAYSNDQEVIDHVAKITPLLAISAILDGVQGVLSGVARGCGWQRIGAYVNLGAYYLVGLPAATVLAFVFHCGGKGLWTGVLFGLLVQAILLCAVTIATNWEKQANEAAARVLSSLASILPDEIVV